MLKQLEENLRSFHFSESYIRENVSNTEKWAKSGLLQDVEDPYVWRQLSRLFENQAYKNLTESTETDFVRWRRLAIPCIRRIYANFLPYQLVSVQALSKPEDICNFTGLDGRQNTQIIQTRLRRIIPYEFIEDEIKFVVEMSTQYLQEIENEIVKDLIHVASSRADAKYKDDKELLTLVQGMSAYIGSKLKRREATWIITNPTLAAKLRPLIENRWQLHEKEMENIILMGHKDSRNPYFSGYCYCPYLPFASTENNHIFSRYGKTLINADFYGVINLIEEGVLSDTK
jgi:hypothetical protein